MRAIRKKRIAWTGAGAGIGIAIGWFYATVISSCGGTCVLGASPLLTSILFGLIAGYFAWSTTSSFKHESSASYVVSDNDPSHQSHS